MKSLVMYLAAGISLDLLFLCECWLMHTGAVGKQLQVNFNRETRVGGKRVSIVISCISGIIFPPYVFAGLIYFAVRVKQERRRLRDYGRA